MVVEVVVVVIVVVVLVDLLVVWKMNQTSWVSLTGDIMR
jgi:hypothetical protein